MGCLHVTLRFYIDSPDLALEKTKAPGAALLYPMIA
jgi:hypothetical protein